MPRPVKIRPVQFDASRFWFAAFAILGILWVHEFAVAQSPTEPTEPSKEPTKTVDSKPMDNRHLDALLKKHFPDRKIEGQFGMWRIAIPEELAKEAEQPPAAEEAEDADNEPKPGDEPAEGEAEQPIPGAGERLPAVLLVMTDERANRMRVMMPIRKFDPQRMEDLQLALIVLHANYDRALDARYAIQEGVLWSAFIHPLGSLTPDDLESALRQVQTLRKIPAPRSAAAS